MVSRGIGVLRVEDRGEFEVDGKPGVIVRVAPRGDDARIFCATSSSRDCFHTEAPALYGLAEVKPGLLVVVESSSVERIRDLGGRVSTQD